MNDQEIWVLAEVSNSGDKILQNPTQIYDIAEVDASELIGSDIIRRANSGKLPVKYFIYGDVENWILRNDMTNYTFISNQSKYEKFIKKLYNGQNIRVY